MPHWSDHIFFKNLYNPTVTRVQFLGRNVCETICQTNWGSYSASADSIVGFMGRREGQGKGMKKGRVRMEGNMGRWKSLPEQ